MPTYVYKFLETGETIEVQQAFTDEPLTELVHPVDGTKKAVKKVFTPVGVSFKGGGFYKTDSGKITNNWSDFTVRYRWRTRKPKLADFETFAAFLQSDRAAFVGGKQPRVQAWRAFGHLTGHWVLRGYSMFIIADKTTDAALSSISGRVTLVNELKGLVSPTDTVFVYATPVSGSRMPVAIVRTTADKLPLDFVLDDSTAMNPNVKLSSMSEVTVRVRISKSGQATAQAGDLGVSLSPVKPGSKGLNLMVRDTLQAAP